MEESKELQGFYRIFRAAVYVSVLLEFFEYAFDPSVFGDWGGILADLHGRIKRWAIYSDGHRWGCSCTRCPYTSSSIWQPPLQA